VVVDRSIRENPRDAAIVWQGADRATRSNLYSFRPTGITALAWMIGFGVWLVTESRNIERLKGNT
jgi:hypothetical protein